MKEVQTMQDTVFLHPSGNKKHPYQDLAVDFTVVVFETCEAFEEYETPAERKKSRRPLVIGAREYLVIDTHLFDDGTDKPTMTLDLMRFNYDD
jgi:hypothetical protein